MIFALLMVGCAGGAGKEPAAADSAEACEGPAIEDFAAAYATYYCDWAFACPTPPPYDRGGCEDLYANSWESRSDTYLACRAQTCLDLLASGVPPCAGSGTEWVDIEACSYQVVAPASGG